MNKLMDILGITFYIDLYKKKKHGYYQLKPYNNKKVKVINQPPELKKEFNAIEIKNIINKKVKISIAEFINVITSNFPQDFLTNFYNNMHEIKVYSTNYKFKNFIHGIEFNGSYYATTNIIKISENDSQYKALFHELFHLASSTYKNNIIYCGFRQHNKVNSIDVGVGLNEGYTQALTEKFFGNIEGVKYSYPFETFVAKIIEEIISQNKMSKYYFTSNLYGLINELELYNSYNNIINFINNLDFLNKIQTIPSIKNLEQEYIIKALKQIIDFLFYTYENKLKKQYNKGLISNKEYIRNLEIFAINLKNIFYSKKNRYVINNSLVFIDNLPTLNININVSSLNEEIFMQMKK